MKNKALFLFILLFPILSCSDSSQDYTKYTVDDYKGAIVDYTKAIEFNV